MACRTSRSTRTHPRFSNRNHGGFTRRPFTKPRPGALGVLREKPADLPNWHGFQKPIDLGRTRRRMETCNRSKSCPARLLPPNMSAQSQFIDTPEPPAGDFDMIEGQSGIGRQFAEALRSPRWSCKPKSHHIGVADGPVSRCPRFLPRLRSGATSRSREPGNARRVSQDGARQRLGSRPPPSATAAWSLPRQPQPRR